MKLRAFALLVTSLITATALMGNPFFAFDNALGRKFFQVPSVPEDYLKRCYGEVAGNRRPHRGACETIDRLPSGGGTPNLFPCRS